jgi:signal peptidase II
MIQRKHLILLSLSGLIVSFDQLIKTAIINRFVLGESLPVIPNFFNLTLVHNPGAAWGLFANLRDNIREPLFTIVPLCTLAIILFLFQRLEAHQKLSIFSLSAIVGGAVGNLIDRARVGYVIDFLDFHFYSSYHFPAFNLADAAITIGAAILVAVSFTEKAVSK